MVANWLKILLFAAGGTTAAAGTVYYTGLYDPWAVENRSEPVASAERTAPVGAATEPAEPETAVQPDAEPAPVVEEQASEAETDIAALPDAVTEREADLVVPSFDVVRVEPDGSMVIAGSAQPNSQIEVVAGANVLARADVGPGGDFAAVLDDALDPGNYQIVLRSTGPGEGNVTTSLETAIVSVPENTSGQVLALVEEPGAPSKLITVPEGEAALVEGSSSESGSADIDQPSVRDAAPQELASAENSSSRENTEAELAETDANAEGDVANDETEVAAGSEPAAATQERPVSPRNSLAVEAIEIEGGTVFVAGRGTPGATVRVYANEILLGEARVSEGGRFLIETQTNLPVGDYIVRADVLGSGGEVTARAAVPFQREPGEAVAAVAPREPASEAAEAVDGTQRTDDDDNASAGTQRAEPSSQTMASNRAQPSNDTKETNAAPAINESIAPKLEAAEGAVIIRRGDTLWRISRRVYGRGVRYSTIYLANQGQIRDPDMIWPGQIFSVPDETEEGEKADMSTVSDQLAPDTTTQ